MELTIEETLNNIIEEALRKKASDIHIDPVGVSLNVSYRIDGSLFFQRSLSIEYHEGIILRIKVLARLPLDERRLPKDGRFVFSSQYNSVPVEARISMMPTVFGENAVIRIFDPELTFLSFEGLGFSTNQNSALEKALALHAGLIIIAGPTGSGKTTTLYSMISHIKETSSRLVVTIEDPVERKFPNIRQIEVGSLTGLEYASVLKSILRQDPDVIILGEIREGVSAELAIQIALTGHLVITTLHASSVFNIKNRLVQMGISEYLIDEVLILGISQRLVSKEEEGRMVSAKIQEYDHE